MPNPTPSRGPAVALALFLLVAAASAATVPFVQSVRPASPLRLDGKAGDWEGVPRLTDPKTSTEFAFQNDARNLYILVVVRKPEPRASAEATGMTIVGRPAKGRKPNRGTLFVTREVGPDMLIAWRESQGAVFTEQEKAEIRRTPRHAISLAFAVDDKGSSYGPLRKQSEALPPDFASTADEAGMTFEFRLPLAPPETVPGAIGGTPGSRAVISFAWGGASGKSLSTQAGRESPGSRSGYTSGTGRTWGQEFLDTFDSLSRPTLPTKGFKFTAEVGLADAR